MASSDINLHKFLHCIFKISFDMAVKHGFISNIFYMKLLTNYQENKCDVVREPDVTSVTIIKDA